MADWLRCALAILAAYRVAQLISIDHGPFDVFLRLRDWAGVPDRGRDGRPIKELARLLACPYCIGLYASVGFALLALARAAWADAILIIFGVMGGQTYLQGARRAQ